MIPAFSSHSIQDLVQDTAGPKQQKYLSLALIRILGPNTDSFLTKQLTSDQRKRIQNEIKKLEKVKEKKTNKKISKQISAEKLIAELRKNPVDLKTATPIEKESLLEDYYQIAGCKIAYGAWQVGDKILGPHPDLPDYQVHKIIKNKKGLQLVCLIPTTPNPDCGPIICCRGTTSNPHNWVDDMKKNIGLYSVGDSLEEVSETLKEMTNEYGPSVITGHSLGGAVAQIVTTKCFDACLDQSEQPCIKALYTFNSPGAGENIKQEYKQKKTQHPLLAPTVHYYYHVGDVVVLAGRGRIPATKKIKLGAYSFLSFLYSPIQTLRNAHSWKHRVSQFRKEGAYEAVSHLSSSLEKLIRAVSEFFRRAFGIIAHRIILFHIEQRKQEKLAAKQLQQKLFATPLVPLA